MDKVLRIGTRTSQLALWQANQVQQLLQQHHYATEIVPIKSEGDLDLKTPLYAMGVQGVFTRYLDGALLDNRIDLAVHSMKDVPTVLAKGIMQAAVLERGPVRDLLVYKRSAAFLEDKNASATIATGSVRRIAQWLHRYPHHHMVPLRGNVNTRLQKLQENPWDGAVFATAGLSRIDLRPEQSIELDWMLPAPAQGAIMVVCRENDGGVLEACGAFNHANTACCTAVERDFLLTLMGGCSTPISALAEIKDNRLFFKGNIVSADGKEKMEVKRESLLSDAGKTGVEAARELLERGAAAIVQKIKNNA